MKIMNIYADGACSGNQNEENIGGYGAVLEYRNNLKELFDGFRNTTNNIMELKAIIEALKTTKTKEIHIKIYSDSAYVVNCFNQGWYHKWRTNGWINSKKDPVENKELWIEIIGLVETFAKVEFFKVKGHLDLSKPTEVNKWFDKFKKSHGDVLTKNDYQYAIKMNHRADELANMGMDKIRNEQ